MGTDHMSNMAILMPWLFRWTLALHGRYGDTHCPSALCRIVSFLLPVPRHILQRTDSLICSVGVAQTGVRVPLNRGPAGDLSGFMAFPHLFGFFLNQHQIQLTAHDLMLLLSPDQEIKRLRVFLQGGLCVKNYTMNGQLYLLLLS